MTLPVMTSRQVRNSGLRAMGVRPREAYHTEVGPGDEVELLEVWPSDTPPFHRFCVTIFAVVDFPGLRHRVVLYERCDGSTGQAALQMDGPPYWGVIEFRIVRKVHKQRQPEEAMCVRCLRWYNQTSDEAKAKVNDRDLCRKCRKEEANGP